jgi:hypothetical protein
VTPAGVYPLVAPERRGNGMRKPLVPFPFLATGDHHGEEDAEILEQQ